MPILTQATARCDVCGDEQPSAVDHAPRGWWILHPDHPQFARDGWLICPKHMLVSTSPSDPVTLVNQGRKA